MSIHQKDMLVEFGRFTTVSVILYLILGVAYMVCSDCNPTILKVIKSTNVIVGLLCAYNVSAWLLKHNVCKVSSFLASASFFIYVTHGILCGKVHRAFCMLITPADNVSVMSIFILATLVTTAILLVTFYLLRRFAPGILKVVAGRK